MDCGLKFAPPHKLNKFQAFIDVNEFLRKLNVKRYLIPWTVKISNVAIRAKFSPSLANLFMARRTEDVVNASPRPQLVLWRKYNLF